MTTVSELRVAMYGWERCDHAGIGLPGCPVCDPEKHRCIERMQLILDRVAVQRDLAERRAEKAESQLTDLREKLERENICPLCGCGSGGPS